MSRNEKEFTKAQGARGKEEETEDFAGRMTDILNYGAVNLAMAIGYRTRLFDVMDELGKPSTAETIASVAKMNVRYLQEWLGVMVSAQIVELSFTDDDEDLFHLPESRASFITRRAGNANLGVYTQEIPLLTISALDPVVRGFSSGKGVSYDHYPAFQDFMAELANAKHRDVLVSNFLPSVAGGEMIKKLQKGIRVCDLGCAQGVATNLMAQAWPESRFVGIDISEEAIETAKEAANRMGLENVSFSVADAAKLEGLKEMAGSFDYVLAFDAIHDQTHPKESLRGVYAILDKGGAFSMVDIAAGSRLSDNVDHPMGPFLYTVSLMHCMPVGLVDGGLGLGMMWGKEKAVSMLREAGFSNVEVQPIPEDPFNLHFFCVKS